jgi:hypothetical protein
VNGLVEKKFVFEKRLRKNLVYFPYKGFATAFLNFFGEISSF